MKRLIPIIFGPLLLMASQATQAGFLKEFGFCPLGGPPGWYNRLSGQRPPYRFRPYPVYMPMYYSPVQTYRYPLYPQYRYPVAFHR